MTIAKNIYGLICGCLLALASIFLSACSKDSEGDAIHPKSEISMKVNGEVWNSGMTTLFSEAHQVDESKYHLVSMTGGRVIEKNSATEDDIAESITIYIAIPVSKFQNPKGTYPIVWQPNAEFTQASAVFGTSTEIQDATTYVPSPSGQSGTIQISGFEIGQQHVMGHPTGTEGYTKLSGTFQMDLSPLAGTGNGAALKITDGKFNLEVGMKIGF